MKVNSNNKPGAALNTEPWEHSGLSQLTSSNTLRRVRVSHKSSVVTAHIEGSVPQIITNSITTPMFRETNTAVAVLQPRTLPSLESGFSLLQPFFLLDKMTPAGLFSHGATTTANTSLVLRLTYILCAP